MTTELRFISQDAAGVAVETRSDAAPVITGHAAVFYREGDSGTEYELWDGAVERIMPKAFRKTVKEDDIVVVKNHDPNNLLGRTGAGTAKVTVDAIGLRYEAQRPDTNVGRDTVTEIQRGDMNGSSFAFQVTDEEWRLEDSIRVREIRGAKVFDVGPVVGPAYKGTDAGVRSDMTAEARSSFDAWEKREADQATRQDEAAAKSAIEQAGARARACEVEAGE